MDSWEGDKPLSASGVSSILYSNKTGDDQNTLIFGYDCAACGKHGYPRSLRAREEEIRRNHTFFLSPMKYAP